MSYSPFRHIGSVFWKHHPIHLTFFVTRRCNARCSFCFYLSEEHSGESAGELSLDEIEKISSSMGKLFWLAFSGGEIFLRQDIVEITKIFYDRNKPAIILFPTNGLLTDVIKEKVEEALKDCKKSIIVVKLSIDGTEDLNDTLRGHVGAFQKTMQTYEALGEFIDRYLNFELGINTVFCSANQDRMKEVIDLVGRLKKNKTHTISLIRGNVLDERLKEIDSNKYYETIKIMELSLQKKAPSIYRFRGARLKAAQDILQRRLIYETLLQKRQVIPCYAGRLNLVLTEVGDVYPCESFEMKLGNIRDNGYNMRKLLRTEHANEVIHSIQRGGCYCTHECYFMTNILFNPWMYPRLLREYVKLL